MGRRGGGRAPRVNWQNIPKENAQWESYYRQLGVPTTDPESFTEFKKACQRELPVTFRITGTSQDVGSVREIMETQHIAKLKNQTWEGELIEAPKPLSFYPDRLAWQVNVGKQIIRRNPQFSEFQRFLVVETNAGNISRQELVSMIPPLFLKVEPHHTVLDTCASPGSKTTQLIEALHHGTSPAHPPSGLVIANDSDYKRSHMLTHQIKRLNSPNIIVTNHDAQMYPRIWLGSSYLKFDRILCDVPCTGDATMRKNINVWKDWTVANGQGLHTLQLNIATRSVHMLKPENARLVYSTCSLNPIENEAVVAQLLRQFPNLKLVDVSSDLPELKRTSGMSSWQVLTRGPEKKWYSKPEENTDLPRSWFAPTEEEAAKFHLERCVRVYPHQQNSGGFFIAVLELHGEAVEVKDLEQKKRNANGEVSERKRRAVEKEETNEVKPAEDKPTEEKPAEEKPAEEKTSEDKSADGNEEEKKEGKNKKEKLPYNVPSFEEPFKFLAPDHPEVLRCVKFYGIKPEFNLDTLLVRNAEAEPTRTIYYVAPCLKPILVNNEKKIKFIHAGIKLFNSQKNDGECKWRVQIEGIQMLNSYVTKRIVETTDLETLKALCLETFIRFDEIKKLDQSLYDQIINLSEGCCIWRLGGAVYPLWRGKASTNLMAPKENTEEMLLRLFGIDKKAYLKEREAKAEAEKAVEKAADEVAKEATELEEKVEEIEKAE